MNYYNEIKKELINNEAYKKVKDYSKNKSDLSTYYNVGKLLVEAQGGEKRAKYGYDDISEKALKQLILEDLDSFLLELGEGFTYVGNEYKIKMGNTYNYIDLLLFNYVYNSFVVVELKATELKKEHVGQMEVYMNYIDKNVKNINQDKTIGLIISKRDNKLVIEYTSDKRIFNSMYILN